MTDKSQPFGGVLRTKLHRPPAGSDLVSRGRLMEQMDRCLTSPLTLVSAPAGYGKSVMASQWAESWDGPSGWLSLDGGDSDLKGFLQYFLGAVDGACPGVCPATMELLSAAELPSAQVVADHLINEMSLLDDHCVIVLDDYHQLDRSTPVHDFTRRLLEYPPPSLHLVLLTRRDPPLPLLRMRSDNRVNELRMRDLRFTEAETSDFLATAAHLTISETALESLQNGVEGWAVGLRLLTLALRHAGDAEDFLGTLKGGLPQTQEYLLREVLAGLDPQVRDCLLRASLLDRFCPEILDALCGLDDASGAAGVSDAPGVSAAPGATDAPGATVAPSVTGRKLVEILQQENLFTIRLDAGGDWFRYHHLFQDLLKRELRERTSEEEIAALHSRASAWFEAQGLISEAIRHALEAADQVGAAEIVERHRTSELNEDRWHVVERWLYQLPKEVRETRPSLLLGEAWSVYERFQMEKIPAILDRVEPLLEDVHGGEALAAEVAFFRGVMAYWSGEGAAAQEYLTEARAQLPEGRKLVRGLLEFYIGLAKTMTGGKEEAVRELSRRVQDQDFGSGDGVYLSRLIGGLMFIHVISADLAKGRRRVEYFNSVAADSDITYTRTWGFYMAGSIAFHALDLERASEHFSEAAQHRYIMHTGAAINAMAGLALTHQLLGNDDEAGEAVERLEAFARELKEPAHLAVARSCRARIALLQGDLDGALEWARPTVELPTPAGLFIWCEVPAITRARILIAKGSQESLREAAEMLGAIQTTSEAHHFKQQAIEAAVLLALAREGLGQAEEAQGILVEALNLARSGGFIRPFVEAGGRQAEMLERLEGSEREGEFVRRILAASRVAGGEAATPGLVEGSPAPVEVALVAEVPGDSTRRLRPPVDSLTNREFEVLDLLAQRLRDKEIASRLFISTQTVNYHLKNTYRKLGVSSRREAVARAVELGILPSGRD